MLIGGYAGIAVLTGRTVTGVLDAPSPSWIGRHPTLPVLYAVAEEDPGTVAAWALRPDGTPGEPLGRADTGGADPCHFAVDPTGRYLVTANYSGGSVAVHALEAGGGIGARTDLVAHPRPGRRTDGGGRQGAAHPHMVAMHGGEVLVVDLGGDAIHRYTMEAGRLRERAIVTAPAGSGPRHLHAHGDRVYVAAELSGEILVYDASWTLLGAVPAGDGFPSGLAVRGDRLYAGVRGPDTVAVFALDGPLPRRVGDIPVGAWPRDLAVVGDELWVAAERGHEVTVHALDGTLRDRIAMKSPACILPL